jgi:hypothetical protein
MENLKHGSNSTFKKGIIMTQNLTQKHLRHSLFNFCLVVLVLVTFSVNVPAATSSPQKNTFQSTPLDQDQPIFLPAQTFIFGGGLIPSSMAVADINGDSKPDLITVGGALVVQLGNGDGTFQPQQWYFYLGCYPSLVAVADVNGDHIPDLVLAGGKVVDVLLGSGDGTFSELGTYATGGKSASSMAVADINDDGILDVVVANSDYESTVGVLLGNGDGTFQAPTTYPSLGARWVAVADVNHDNKPDVVVANWSSAPDDDPNGLVGVLLGNGDGTFQPGVAYATGGYYASALSVQDVNGDGNPDLLVMSVTGAGGSGPGVVGVLLGNGNGTFQPAVTYVPGPSSLHRLAVQDVNLDGRPDLLVSSGRIDDMVGRVTLLRGNGDGTFGSPQDYDSGGFGASAMALDDLNGDRRPDLLVGNDWVLYEHGYAGGTGVLLNNAGAPSTTTSLISDHNPTDPRQVITYTASVTAESGGAVTGTITFRDANKFRDQTLAKVPLSDNHASYSQKYTKAGIHPISATYSGDLQNGGSTSETLTEYVQDGSNTLVITSGSPSYLGQPVTFTARVWPRNISGIPIPDGDLVSFYDGASLLGSVPLQNQVASFTTSSLSAKKHLILAEYLGDSLFKPSHDSVAQAVEKFSTTTTLTSTPNPSSFGEAVTFTAIVAASGNTLPTGRVTLWDGESAIGLAKLNGGTATFSKSKLALGTHSITARYLGDATFRRSISPPLNQVVQ